MKIDLEEHLDTWTEEGLISREQAAAIRARERSGDQGGRIPLIAEALGYLGAVLALVAGTLVVSDVWEELTAGGRVALAATVTVALIWAGWWIRDAAAAAIQRLASVLWFVGAAGVAFTAGLVGYEFAGLEEVELVLAIGLAVTVAGAGLWWLRRRTLQLLALFAGVVATVMSLLGLPDATPGPMWFGLALYGLGLAWGLLAWGGVLTPRTAGEVLAILALGQGAQIMAADERPVVGLVIGIVTAGALLGLSVALRRTLLLAFGAAGVFVFVPQLVFHLFADTLGAPLALFLTGLLLVIAAIGTAKLRGEVGQSGRVDAETAATGSGGGESR